MWYVALSSQPKKYQKIYQTVNPKKTQNLLEYAEEQAPIVCLSALRKDLNFEFFLVKIIKNLSGFPLLHCGNISLAIVSYQFPHLTPLTA